MIAFVSCRSRHMIRLAVLAIAAGIAVARGESNSPNGSAAYLEHRPNAIVVGSYVDRDGALQSSAIIFLAKGKISSIEAATDSTSNISAVQYPDATACPGLIDLRSSIGAVGHLSEKAEAIDPGASALDSLDRRHRDFDRALQHGVTTVVLTPSENNLVSGAAAVVKTAAVEGSDGVLRADGPLMFSFSPRVWEYDRAPTSRMGSLAMLRVALEQAKSGTGHARLQGFVGGSCDALVYCDEPMDVSAALRLLGEFSNRFTIVHNGETQEVLDDLATAKRGVVIGPLEMEAAPRVLAAAGALSAGGVSVAFAGDLPRHNAASLRVTAALAVRYGMDTSAARRAITSAAADAAGVADRVGAISPGRDADLVIFSADPLRPDARVLAVYVDGVRVYAAVEQAMHGGKRP